jgi:hypothetical protein
MWPLPSGFKFFLCIRVNIVSYVNCLVENLRKLYLAQRIYEIYKLPNDEHDILLIFEQRFGGECISTQERKQRQQYE